MRSKEEAHDYRFFPDPDLPPITLNKEYIEKIRAQLPELPDERKNRFISEYALPEYDAGVLTSVKQVADYFETTVKAGANSKKASNWIMNDLLANVENLEDIFSCKITPVALSKLIAMIDDNTISGKIGKMVFSEMMNTGEMPDLIVTKKGLSQVTDSSEIEKIVEFTKTIEKLIL